jgi:hypothetical protein
LAHLRDIQVHVDAAVSQERHPWHTDVTSLKRWRPRHLPVRGRALTGRPAVRPAGSPPPIFHYAQAAMHDRPTPFRSEVSKRLLASLYLAPDVNSSGSTCGLLEEIREDLQGHHRLR